MRRKLVAGRIVHWDDDPKDRGVILIEENGNRIVLWFDAECYCDDVDDLGWTCWHIDPTPEQYIDIQGRLRWKKGNKRIRRAQHRVIATAEIKPNTLKWAHARFNAFCKRRKYENHSHG